MKTNLLFTIFLLLFINSCQLINNNKDKEAIKLVQSEKFGVMNAYSLNMYNMYGSQKNSENLGKVKIIDPNATNQEAANVMASIASTDHFEWGAKSIGNDIFLVSFYNIDKSSGVVWEADVANQIVRLVTGDSELTKKYNIQ